MAAWMRGGQSTTCTQHAQKVAVTARLSCCRTAPKNEATQRGNGSGALSLLSPYHAVHVREPGGNRPAFTHEPDCVVLAHTTRRSTPRRQPLSQKQKFNWRGYPVSRHMSRVQPVPPAAGGGRRAAAAAGARRARRRRGGARPRTTHLSAGMREHRGARPP